MLNDKIEKESQLDKKEKKTRVNSSNLWSGSWDWDNLIISKLNKIMKFKPPINLMF
jgi:hypothetical protein